MKTEKTTTKATPKAPVKKATPAPKAAAKPVAKSDPKSDPKSDAKTARAETRAVPQKTYMANAQTVQREWLLVDAANMPIGRLASQVAHILRGKHKPTFTPHCDAGDYVIVINSDKVVLTGKKLTDKYYFSHSGYVGGDKHVQAKIMLEKKSDYAVERAIKGMLPKNSLGRNMYRKLKVYKGDKHPHSAQQPRKIQLLGVREK